MKDNKEIIQQIVNIVRDECPKHKYDFSELSGSAELKRYCEMVKSDIEKQLPIPAQIDGVDCIIDSITLEADEYGEKLVGHFDYHIPGNITKEIHEIEPMHQHKSSF